MLIEKIISGTWCGVRFEDMRMSDESGYKKADFENFAEIKFRAVAESFGVKYDLIKDVLYGRNIEFFKMLTELFEQYEYINKEEDEEEFETLTRLLRIPCNETHLNVVEQFFCCFEDLSLKDKMAVVSRFSSISINTPCSVGDKSSEFLKHFSELPWQEKCRVIEQIFKTSVTITSNGRSFI